MPAIAIAVVAYLAFGVTGLGVAVTLLAAAMIAAYAFGPTGDDVAAVLGAINATYPESRASRITAHLSKEPGGRISMAKVYSILQALEDEGTIQSFNVEGRNHPTRKGLPPAPVTFWRVVRGRGDRKPRASLKGLLPTFGLPSPA